MLQPQPHLEFKFSDKLIIHVLLSWKRQNIERGEGCKGGGGGGGEENSHWL
jgi:hypothetical protein